MAAPARCRLLGLPPELRTLIYEYALAPTGTLSLTTTSTKRFATIPQVSPQLLATCRQIHAEAADLLFSGNSICITVDAHDNCWPTISEKRLPQRVLEQLQHACIILDTVGIMYASYRDVDWMMFQALVSLRTVRFAVLVGFNPNTQGGQRNTERNATELLREVVARVPRETAVEFGTREGSGEREMVERLVAAKYTVNLLQWAHEDDAADLSRRIYPKVRNEQGRLSGGVADVFAEYRDGFQR